MPLLETKQSLCNHIMTENKTVKLYLQLKDHSVSGEEFGLIYNSELDMLETFPRPSEEKLSDYYESDDYISHTDSKRNLLEIVYQKVKSISLKRKLSLIDSFSLEGRNLLDLGCGTGDFLKTAKEHGWEITGIEPNQTARNLANQKTENSVFDSAELPNLPNQSFDIITLWHVLEHLPNLENHLSIFKSLLKPNGSLVVAVPNFKSYDAQYYKSHWAAYDVPRHLWHFSKASISKLVNKQHMVLEKTLPLTFDAYYVSLLSEKYKNGFMNPIKAFWTAWRSNFAARKTGEFSSLIYIIKNQIPK